MCIRDSTYCVSLLANDMRHRGNTRRTMTQVLKALFPDSPAPVSYTHLDVYKRQGSREAHKLMKTRLLQVTLVTLLLTLTSLPVSYTHLLHVGTF